VVVKGEHQRQHNAAARELIDCNAHLTGAFALHNNSSGCVGNAWACLHSDLRLSQKTCFQSCLNRGCHALSLIEMQFHIPKPDPTPLPTEFCDFCNQDCAQRMPENEDLSQKYQKNLINVKL
jgi:hypothetical protein